MTGFDVVKSDNKEEMLTLSEKLSHGKDLSIFFLGTGNYISEHGMEHHYNIIIYCFTFSIRFKMRLTYVTF